MRGSGADDGVVRSAGPCTTVGNGEQQQLAVLAFKNATLVMKSLELLAQNPLLKVAINTRGTTGNDRFKVLLAQATYLVRLQKGESLELPAKHFPKLADLPEVTWETFRTACVELECTEYSTLLELVETWGDDCLANLNRFMAQVVHRCVTCCHGNAVFHPAWCE